MSTPVLFQTPWSILELNFQNKFVIIWSLLYLAHDTVTYHCLAIFPVTVQISFSHYYIFSCQELYKQEKQLLFHRIHSFLETGYDTFLSDKGKDDKNSTQYIKQLEISAHDVPKHNQMAVLYMKHSRDR